MILILDNNEYRRHDVCLSLSMKKYIVAEQSLDVAKFFTKPNMTVYLNPNYDELNKIEKTDTITVVAKNFVKQKLPSWIKVIPLDSCLIKNLVEIFETNCNYGKGREFFGIIALEGKKFSFGGKYISMTPQQLRIIKLFLYNPDKVFELYDASSYFDFVCDQEIGFADAVDSINQKCIREGREKIIVYKSGRYRINQDVLKV